MSRRTAKTWLNPQQGHDPAQHSPAQPANPSLQTEHARQPLPSTSSDPPHHTTAAAALTSRSAKQEEDSIQRSAQAAFFWMHGMRSTAWNRWSRSCACGAGAEGCGPGYMMQQRGEGTVVRMQLAAPPPRTEPHSPAGLGCTAPAAGRRASRQSQHLAAQTGRHFAQCNLAESPHLRVTDVLLEQQAIHLAVHCLNGALERVKRACLRDLHLCSGVRWGAGAQAGEQEQVTAAGRFGKRSLVCVRAALGQVVQSMGSTAMQAPS